MNFKWEQPEADLAQNIEPFPPIQLVTQDPAQFPILGYKKRS
jgi:hypothetical protein